MRRTDHAGAAGDPPPTPRAPTVDTTAAGADTNDRAASAASEAVQPAAELSSASADSPPIADSAASMLSMAGATQLAFQPVQECSRATHSQHGTHSVELLAPALVGHAARPSTTIRTLTPAVAQPPIPDNAELSSASADNPPMAASAVPASMQTMAGNTVPLDVVQQHGARAECAAGAPSATAHVRIVDTAASTHASTASIADHEDCSRGYLESNPHNPLPSQIMRIALKISSRLMWPASCGVAA